MSYYSVHMEKQELHAKVKAHMKKREKEYAKMGSVDSESN